MPAPLAERSQGSFLCPLGRVQTSTQALEKDAASPMERRTSNTFRQRYLDNEFLVRPNASVPENSQEDFIAS